MTVQLPIVVESDASTYGMGGTYDGGDPAAHQLPGGSGSLPRTVRDKSGVSVLLRLDYTSVVSYVNKLGGMVSPKLNTIVREVLQLETRPRGRGP